MSKHSRARFLCFDDEGATEEFESFILAIKNAKPYFLEKWGPFWFNLQIQPAQHEHSIGAKLHALIEMKGDKLRREGQFFRQHHWPKAVIVRRESRSWSVDLASEFRDVDLAESSMQLRLSHYY